MMLLTKTSTASYFLVDQGLIWISITQKMNISELDIFIVIKVVFFADNLMLRHGKAYFIVFR